MRRLLRGRNGRTALETLKGDGVASFRQLDANRIIAAFGGVIFLEFCAQPANIDPNNRIDARIVGCWVAPIDRDADIELLKLVTLAGDCLLNQILKETSTALRAGEASRSQYLLKSGLTGIVRQL